MNGLIHLNKFVVLDTPFGYFGLISVKTTLCRTKEFLNKKKEFLNSSVSMIA